MTSNHKRNRHTGTVLTTEKKAGLLTMKTAKRLQLTVAINCETLHT